MLFYLVTGIIIVIYGLYPRSKWEASVFLFVAFIMQGRILGADDQFMGFIDHRSVVSALLIYSSFKYKSRILTISKNNMDLYKKLSLYIVVLLILILNKYIQIKNELLTGDIDIWLISKRFLRDFIVIYAAYQIVRKMYNKSTYRGIEDGILLGMIISITSMLFYGFFEGLGFSIHTGVDESYNRLTGFMGENANAAAGIFSVVYGYILARVEQTGKFTKKYIFIISLVLIGILTVASRTGLVIIVLLTLIYVFRTSTSVRKSVASSLVVIVLAAIYFIFFGDLMAERVQSQISGEFDTLSSRESYWVMYLNDLYNNPNWMIIGNLGEPTYHRSVHNTYIHYLFSTGLIPFIIILNIFWRFYKYRNRYRLNEFYFTPIYSLFALMIAWITGAGYVNYWFMLIMAASSGIPYIIVKNNQLIVANQKANSITNA